MTQSRGSHSSTDDSDTLSYQEGDMTINHMFSGTASYESKRQYKMVAEEVLVVILKCRQAIKWLNIDNLLWSRWLS